MLTKQGLLEVFLSSECANCSSQINEEEKFTEVKLKGVNPGGIKSNFEALSFMYKMPPEELIANVQSYFQNVIDDCSGQSKDTMELFSQNVAFCGRCARQFGEVYRAHRIFNQWSTVNNLLSKAIRHNNTQLCENDIKMEIEESESTLVEEIKPELNDKINDGEINSSSVLQDEETNNDEDDDISLEQTSLSNFSDVESESIMNPKSAEMNCEPDPPMLQDNEEDPNSLDHPRIIPDTDCIDKTTSEANSTDFTTHNTTKGPSFICPKDNKLFPDKAAVITHCKNDYCTASHQLFLPKLTKHSEILKGPALQCPKCNISFGSHRSLSDHCRTQHNLLLFKLATHNEIIKGHPFQCPKCNMSFGSHHSLSDHCTTRHLLSLPAQRKSTKEDFSCSKCKLVFQNMTDWKVHCRLKHNSAFFCVLCTSCFVTNEDLVSHLKISCESKSKCDNSNKSSPSNELSARMVTTTTDCKKKRPLILSSNCFRSDSLKFKKQKYCGKEIEINSPSVSQDDENSNNDEDISFQQTSQSTSSGVESLNITNSNLSKEIKGELDPKDFLSTTDSLEIEKVKTTEEFTTYDSEIKGPPYYCPICIARKCSNMIFMSLYGLSNHCKHRHKVLIPVPEMQIYNTNKDKPMYISGQSLTSVVKGIKLTTHNEIIKGPPFQCPKCNESFENYTSLKYHCQKRHQLLLPFQRKSKKGNFSCSKCNSNFKSSNGWKIHCRLMHNRLFFCMLCTSDFATNEDLLSHLKNSCESIRSSSSNEIPGPSNLSEREGIPIQDGNHDHSTSSKLMKVNQSEDSQLTNINTVKSQRENTENISCAEKSPNLTCDSKDNDPTHKYKFRCSECEECFLEKEDFTKHLKTVHYEKFVSCQRPDKTAEPIPSNSSPLTCTKCGLNFEHYDLLSKHSQDIHSITLGSYEQHFFHYICRKCDTLFQTLCLLSAHLTKCCAAGSVKMFDCKYCPTTFNTSQKLTAHLKFVHDIKMGSLSLGYKPKTSKCSICCKVYVSEYYLRYHRLLSREEISGSAAVAENPSGVKENNTEIICQPCNIRFVTKVGLSYHLKTKHQKEIFKGPFNCDVCNKSYKRKDVLHSHIKMMHGKKTAKCKICNKELSVSSMSRHVRIVHTGYKPFKCQYCDKTFVTGTDCKNHEASHGDARPFACSICDRGFKLRVQMKRHRETHNTGKSYMCHRCGIGVKTRDTYNSHMRLHKQDDLAGTNPKCSECNKVFSTGAQLRSHKRLTHNKHGPIPCPVCGKKFALRCRVNTHLKTMHPESI